MSRRQTRSRFTGAAVIHCAIYTRKSSEEGLEQEFNSLDAQREACEAYVLSQKSVGWVAIPEMYGDGGISGGTMERPALRRLLVDIEAGRVDTVVVYKVDRLTRSLNDFAKIVDAFDARTVSFVSVTQQFNTTTSMGRLTLNMLLSFAQFEREVTGERIRDKIAASKQKGMWMGGNPPLGYDIPVVGANDTSDRRLVVNAVEAETVRHIFRRYAELKSVLSLQHALDRDGIVSKRRKDRDGHAIGGKPLARGALYLMLQNRIYRGEIVHKDSAYPGLHDAIIDQLLWDEVQAALTENRVERVTRSKATDPSLLAGLVFDESGDRMSPTHANKKGTRYRYYVSQSLIKRGRPTAEAAACRVPAADLERLVEDRICVMLRDAAYIREAASEGTVANHKEAIAHASKLADGWYDLTASHRGALLRALIARTEVRAQSVHLTVRLSALPAIIKPDLDMQGLSSDIGGPTDTLIIPAWVKRTGMSNTLLIPSPLGPGAPGRSALGPIQQKADRSLLRLIGQAHRCRRLLDRSTPDMKMAEIAALANLSPSYFSRVLKLSFLAPDITKAILQGRQPPDLTANRLMIEGRLPTAWTEQIDGLGLI